MLDSQTGLFTARYAADFSRKLFFWFRKNKRKLPWRESPSLYKTVVSELMLQQTQVKTALPYFQRWMKELPDFHALATAEEAQVLKLWEGLGYYSRARNLHRLARELERMPNIPQDEKSWQKLPGIGPYTAAAITSIAFGNPLACVDGNVVRILSRITANGTVFRDSASAAKAFRPLAQSLLPIKHPGAHNEAMMELGAVLCKKHHPLCEDCPVQFLCTARKLGNDAPEHFPKLASKSIEQRTVTRIWCLHEGKLLLHLADSNARRLANLHELPAIEHLPKLPATALRPIARKRRGITRYQITEIISALECPPEGKLAPNLLWVAVSALDKITLSGPHRKWITEILKTESSNTPSLFPNINL